jgi:hypothetical protein
MELERRGVKTKDERGRPALAPLYCRVCKAQNLATATFCQQCRNPVSPEAEKDLEARRQQEIKDAATRLMTDSMKKHIAAEIAKALAAAEGTRKAETATAIARDSNRRWSCAPGMVAPMDVIRCSEWPT